jgi:hypothetical protein
MYPRLMLASINQQYFFMENTKPHQKNQKIEAGKLYRADAGDYAAMKGSVWFRGCLTDGSLVYTWA